jgi:hypothetical protein
MRPVQFWADLVQQLFRLIILGTTAYVVFGLGHSGWWFLFAILLM